VLEVIVVRVVRVDRETDASYHAKITGILVGQFEGLGGAERPPGTKGIVSGIILAQGSPKANCEVRIPVFQKRSFSHSFQRSLVQVQAVAILSFWSIA